MAARMVAIRQACSLQPDLRTEENIDDILEFVKDVKFFAKLTLAQQRTLCRMMAIEEFASRENVFEIGDAGSKHYIILSGSVAVQVHSRSALCPQGVHSRPESCDCPGRPLDTVVVLEPRMAFGEMSLQSTLPRSATIQATEHSEFLVTEKEDYEMYAGQLHRQFVEQRVSFLRGCPSIEEALQRMIVSMQDIVLMANCLQETRLNGNSVACRQGDPVDQIIFVRSGSLAMIRAVDADAAASYVKDELQDTCICAPPLCPSEQEQVTATASACRCVSVRPRCKVGTSLKDDRNLSGEEDAPAYKQTEHQFANNLAKLMREVKKKERAEKRDELMEKGVIAGNDRNWEGPGTLEKHGSVTIDRVKGDKIKNVSVRVDSGGDTDEVKKASSGNLWKKVSKAVALANNQNRFLTMMGGFEGDAATTASEETAEQNVEAAQRSIEHLSSVSRARKRYDEVRFKDMRERSLKSHGKTPRRGSRLGTSQGGSDCKRRKLLLRVGTVGSNQYFGDQQIRGTETYPATLVSDPEAELYIMSKHDIFRRLPKKLFSALFVPEKEQRATDAQLLDMHRQMERWGAFRKAMRGEALSQVGLRNPGMSVHRPLRDPCNSARVDPLANLDFLGVHPRSALGRHLLQTPTKGPTGLTAKDEELFSQASARFLRRVDVFTQDPGLRSTLAKLGRRREVARYGGQEGGRGCASGGHASDPMAVRFEQHWAKLPDQIGLDLDDALEDKPTMLTRGSLSARISVSRPRGSLNVASSSSRFEFPVTSISQPRSPVGLPWSRDVFGCVKDAPDASQSLRGNRDEALGARCWRSTSGSHGTRKAMASLPARHQRRHAPIVASRP